MRSFRFSILQLLLAATLVALVLGLVTSAWRASRYQAIQQVCFSPSGNHLAAHYNGGGVQVWRLDQRGPRLIARAFGQAGLFFFDFGSIHFVTDDKLLKVETPFGSATPGTRVRQLDVNSREVADVIQIDSTYPYSFPVAHAATAERLLLSDWNSNITSSFSLKSGRLERKWSLPLGAVWQAKVSANGKTLAA